MLAFGGKCPSILGRKCLDLSVLGVLRRRMQLGLTAFGCSQHSQTVAGTHNKVCAAGFEIFVAVFEKNIGILRVMLWCLFLVVKYLCFGVEKVDLSA